MAIPLRLFRNGGFYGYLTSQIIIKEYGESQEGVIQMIG